MRREAVFILVFVPFGALVGCDIFIEETPNDTVDGINGPNGQSSDTMSCSEFCAPMAALGCINDTCMSDCASYNTEICVAELNDFMECTAALSSSDFYCTADGYVAAVDAATCASQRAAWDGCVEGMDSDTPAVSCEEYCAPIVAHNCANDNCMNDCQSVVAWRDTCPEEVDANMACYASKAESDFYCETDGYVYWNGVNQCQD